MASLSPSTDIGGSASSLVRSAASLTSQIQAYNDSLQAFQYQNSAYTDDSFSSYKTYLQDRIDALSSSGSVADASKALTLTKTLEAATKSNISAGIQRENIQIMAGNASLTDKYNLVAGQFQRAIANGDLTLAQSLESQAYSINQSIQYQAQQAASASSALAKAGNGTTTGTSGVTYQGEVVSNLKDALGYFKGLAKNASEAELNAAAKSFVTSNKDVFQALGVNIATDQPNYFDVVNGVVGAIYNAQVLKAQAEAPINPLVSRSYAIEAGNILSGDTKFSTLAGDLSFQQIQQASADPNMLAYDSTSGTYKITTQVGYQYQSFTDPSGKQYNGIAPVYSGIVGGGPSSKVFFLTPNETKVATNLGLNFTQTDVNKEVAAGHQVGVGVPVQASASTPDWLQKILGTNGVTKLYTDPNGDITFEGAAGNGQGQSYYTLVTDGSGLHGIFEHTVDGTTKLAGGDYGFHAGAAQLLINQAQQVQTSISLQKQMQEAELKLAPPAPLPAISVPRPAAPVASIAPPTKALNQPVAPHIVAPQAPTVQPQQAATTGSGINVQAGGNFNLQGAGAGSIKL